MADCLIRFYRKSAATVRQCGGLIKELNRRCAKQNAQNISRIVQRRIVQRRPAARISRCTARNRRSTPRPDDTVQSSHAQHSTIKYSRAHPSTSQQRAPLGTAPTPRSAPQSSAPARTGPPTPTLPQPPSAFVRPAAAAARHRQLPASSQRPLRSSRAG